ncbi:DegQ family serine endoprotease [Pseudooceanicola sp. CBS1P-1]|uniref:Probable periplasmic serine endoprotease DegP-like n=1 Tax=Pseudooceanicola albus TaxID=2692189 RepID=A0A6L7G666_9RHOB|nr:MULTISPECIES: DegQ family serine endoprotease [Pseudooceanicola]MBT9385602.1 DegQ family serine endoprotease [Pseudooceanicola endophyticus]MXN18988.1 Do family serine endopeptidase [Pseudooceanicola albus]
MMRQASALRIQSPQVLRAFWMGVIATVMLLGQTMAARALPDSFADLADKVSPAVVMITTSTTVTTSDDQMPMVPEGSPFEDFFKDFQNRNNDKAKPHRSQALGSGFVISEDGYIVTNNHVIENADSISIEFYDGHSEDAKLVGTDPNTDIALLKVEAKQPLPFVTFGDSDKARVGDWVIAMGNPLGQGFSVTSGIVSARNRALSGTYDDYIQTDAAINRGNSGGPLFNLNGEVIGVNTAILSPNGGSIGIGFSMASNVVSKVVDQLKKYGETRRGWLGVRIQDVTKDMADAMGLASTNGAMVTDVPDGPAKDAGMQAGDVITNFDGKDVTDTRELVRQVGNTAVGKAVRVTVWRNGNTETLKVTLGRRETSEAATPAAQQQDDQSTPESSDLMGMKLSALTSDMKSELGLDDDATGLAVTDVDEMSEAYTKGIRTGDVITSAGQEKVETVADLQARIDDAKKAGRKSVLLLIRRGSDPRFVALPLDGAPEGDSKSDSK